MSEFSESYHLRGSDINEAAALLRRAGLKGYVFPPSNGWISFVAEQNSFEPDPRVVVKNTGTLLHYVSAEDHGWSFALFEGADLACGYGCNWDEDVQVDDSRYSAVARFGKWQRDRDCGNREYPAPSGYRRGNRLTALSGFRGRDGPSSV